jgi:DNA-binding NarL/FixJ family response regulator
MIRVLIADDHPVMRAGLAALLRSVDDMDVVAVVSDGRQAVDAVLSHRPDVALLDLQMPNLDGLGALREITRLAPGTAPCVLTMFDDDDSLFAAMRAGARGYLLKGAEQEDIVRAVRAVHAGDAVFGPGVATRILRQLTEPVTTARAFPQLTPREYEALDLIAAGRPTAAIANRLGIAAKTVSNIVSSVLVKLQVSDRAQAAAQARDAGLGQGTQSPPAPT